MRRYSEFLTDAGLDEYKKRTAPPAQRTFYAYVEGKAIECASMSEAAKLSKKTESVITNRDELRAFANERVEIHKTAYKQYMLYVREQVPLEITDKQFDLLLNHTVDVDNAEERAHEIINLADLFVTMTNAKS